MTVIPNKATTESSQHQTTHGGSGVSFLEEFIYKLYAYSVPLTFKYLHNTLMQYAFTCHAHCFTAFSSHISVK